MIRHHFLPRGNPSIHKKPGENYIRDWVHLANMQLLLSGACFGLDVENIKYVIAPNDILNKRKCKSESKDILEYTIAYFWFQEYRDSVIFLFRWGDDPDEPTLQGCSSLCRGDIFLADPDDLSTGQNCPGGALFDILGGTNYILMPMYAKSMWSDGRLILSNNLLTHEFGHFMGVGHPYPRLASTLNQLAGISGGYKYNCRRWPLTEEYVPDQMCGTCRADDEECVSDDDCTAGDSCNKTITWQYVQQKIDEAMEEIATYQYPLTNGETPDNADADKNPPARYNFPPGYEITDTPIDVLAGMAYVHGDFACEQELTYFVEKEDPEPHNEEVVIDDNVRTNVMSYWRCNPETQRFSPDQVRRMEYVLENYRYKLVDRVIKLYLPPSKPRPSGSQMACYPQYVPWIEKRFVPPWEPITRWEPGRVMNYLRNIIRTGEFYNPNPFIMDFDEAYDDCDGCDGAVVFPLPDIDR